MTLPGINADNDGLTEVAAGLFDQCRVFYGRGTQDDAVYPGFEQFFYRVQTADAAADLGRN
jgi:hypothetical protein